MDILEIKNVLKEFNLPDGGRLEILDKINFSVSEGEFLAIVGPSGSGKSTLLRMIAGLEKETAGRILFKGEEIEVSQPTISFIFQNFALFPWLDVFQNVAFPLKMSGTGKESVEREVKKWIEEVGLGGFEKAHPKQLSGGMKQRVGIARALVGDTEVILADEPFSALDAFTAKTLRDELLSIWKKYKKTVVMVTHLVEEAVYMADKVIVFSKLPGRIEKVIENKIKRPRDMRSREFFEMVDLVTSAVNIQ